MTQPLQTNDLMQSRKKKIPRLVLVVGFTAFIAITISLLLYALIPLVRKQTSQVLMPSSEQYAEIIKEELKTEEKTVFENVAFDEKINVSLPKNLSIYRVEGLNNTYENLHQNLIAKYDLKQSTTQTNVWENVQENHYLITYEPNLSLDFKIISLTTPSSRFSSEQNVLSLANTLLKSIGFPEPPTNAKVAIEYFEGGEELKETVIGNADYAQITYTPKLDSGTIYTDKTQESYLSILLNTSGELIKFNYEAAGFNFEQTESRPTVSADAIKEAVQKGTFQTVSVHTNDFDGSYDFKITNLNITNIEPIYRYNLDHSLIFPYFKISGSGTTNYGVSYTADLIIPAIAL